MRQLAQPYKRLAYARCATTSSAERPPLRPGKLTTMTITPTRRCWLASGRLLLAVLLISLGGTALLCLSGAESSLVMCMASTP
ncbi:hypothetical protein D621_08910 [beta proteobacterium AAP51]|nr:hypothetical protein D621_08910 [beta proteobacterium AAP51]